MVYTKTVILLNVDECAGSCRKFSTYLSMWSEGRPWNMFFNGNVVSHLGQLVKKVMSGSQLERKILRVRSGATQCIAMLVYSSFEVKNSSPGMFQRPFIL